MRNALPITVLLSFVLGALPSSATTMAKVTRTCPIGGEKYESFEIMSTSSFGRRLDLRPIGPAAYLPVPECPNGFVVFKEETDFTLEEIAKLTPVVASDEYQRMRKEHVVMYRIAYLRRVLGTPERELAWTLMKAAFEAEDTKNESLRLTYLTEARRAYEADLAARTAHDDNWWTANIQLAEIARQQSRFDDSIAILAPLPVSDLSADNNIPEFVRQIRAKATAHNPDPAPVEPLN